LTESCCVLPDDLHNANVSGCYVALRACAELGINRISFASSVNAIGLEFSRRSTFDYFPLDHKHKTYAEDPYSLSKWECEQQCDSFVRRYESMRIASFRMHEVAPVAELERDEKTDKMVLWSHSDPTAVARACLLGITVEKDDWKTGHEIFYIVSPKNVSYKTRGEKLTNTELAQRYYPNVRSSLSALRHDKDRPG
jgi:nucleoside-diphosphate-sugar epimerase